MPSFRYKALTQNGELVSGLILAPNAREVANRVEYLGLVPIETSVDESASSFYARANFFLISRPRLEDVTVFTRDLALLLKAGARIDGSLELLANDADIGRLRPIIAKIRNEVMAGESFADAISHHASLFPPIYVALVRVGEASGTLDHMLEVIANERTRSEMLRRKLSDALRYPAFVLFGAGCVLIFFLLFVLPQFAAVLRDFGAKLDPVVATFLGLSDFLRANPTGSGITVILLIAGVWFAIRNRNSRTALIATASRLPLVRSPLAFHRTTLFCRNLGVLLSSGVTLSSALRILAEMMAATGDRAVWSRTVDHVRHGGKLSDALADSAALPTMAVRMLRLGEETGQLPVLAARIADFYETKLQRSLDRIVGIAGPLAIIVISTIVGGLIVSVMTALLSVSQIVS